MIVENKKIVIEEFYTDPRTGRKLLAREMNHDDLSRICTLEKELFVSPWSELTFTFELDENQFSRAVVVADGSEIIAYLMAHILCDEMHITNVAVARSYQRRGIAEWLLRRIMEKGVENGVRLVHLEVRRSNVAAITLYYKLGFEIVGVRKKYYVSEGEDAIVMSLRYKDQRADGRST